MHERGEIIGACKEKLGEFQVKPESVAILWWWGYSKSLEYLKS
jgi:hypothetical protein